MHLWHPTCPLALLLLPSGLLAGLSPRTRIALLLFQPDYCQETRGAPTVPFIPFPCKQSSPSIPSHQPPPPPHFPAHALPLALPSSRSPRGPKPMTTPSPPPLSGTAVTTPGETLDHILHHLLPVLLVAAFSVKSFVGRWRLLHSKLSILQSSLADAACSPHWPANPLFVDLLPSLLSTLRSLHSLSTRCLDPSLPAGKLLLQSDLDIAASTLSLHLHDLDLLLRSGLLHHLPSAGAIVLPLPGPSATRADLSLFARDLFARLQIGSIDLKNKALDSLLQLLASDPPKLAPIVAADGDLPYLVRLLDPSAHSLIRDQAAAAVSLLATASEAPTPPAVPSSRMAPLGPSSASSTLALSPSASAPLLRSRPSPPILPTLRSSWPTAASRS